MLERVGGMPLEVPRELDIGRTPQMRAKLRRQQLLNRFNPALGFVFEPVFSYKNRLQTFNGGGGANARGNGDDDVGNALPGGFSAALRTIELFAAADVDTYARAYVIATGHGEAVGEAGSEEFLKASFEIEEAAIQTTSLPYNLSIRGGRFFADWGYLGRRHAHDLPQIDPPPSFSILYDRNRTDGLEFSWLSPTETYLQINAGWGFNFGQLSEDALAQRRQQINHGNTFFGVVRTYKDITDDHNVELGFSWLYGAQVRIPEAETAALLAIDSDTPIDRTTLDIDFHYRWYPLEEDCAKACPFMEKSFMILGKDGVIYLGTPKLRAPGADTPTPNIELVNGGDLVSVLTITSFPVNRHWSLIREVVNLAQRPMPVDLGQTLERGPPI